MDGGSFITFILNSETCVFWFDRNHSAFLFQMLVFKELHTSCQTKVQGLNPAPCCTKTHSLTAWPILCWSPTSTFGRVAFTVWFNLKAQALLLWQALGCLHLPVAELSLQTHPCSFPRPADHSFFIPCQYKVEGLFPSHPLICNQLVQLWLIHF